MKLSFYILLYESECWNLTDELYNLKKTVRKHRITTEELLLRIGLREYYYCLC